MMDYSARFKDILFELRDNGILWITLNKPDKLNAADAAMHQAFVDLWPMIDKDPAVRVAVITGAGRAFSAMMQMSESSATTTPAPTATPLTAEMIGFEQCSML